MRDFSIFKNNFLMRGTICWIVFLSLIMAGCALPEKSVPGPLSRSGSFIVEEHSQALVHWARMGIKEITLVNFDAHDDMRRIPEKKLKKLRAIYNSGDATKLENAGVPGNMGLYNIGNFIYAAADLGIVKEVYWVIPFTYFQGEDPARLLREFMLNYGFPEEAVNTFELGETGYAGTYMDTPVIVCSLDDLPELKDKVAVSIDADFLPAYSEWHGCDRLTSIERMFAALRKARLQTEDFLICYSVNGGYLSVLDRWLVPACSDCARRGPDAEALYSEIRMAYNLARIYYDRGQIDSLLRLTSAYLRTYPGDSTFRSFRVFALFGAGEKEQAIDLAGDCCADNSQFCYLLADLGSLFLDTGAEERAFECYRRAYAGNPDMNYRYREFADALKAAGKYRQAAAYFRRSLELNGGFAAYFQLAAIYRREGRVKKAVHECLSGLKELEDQRYARLDSETDIRAVLEAISLLRSTGHTLEAEKIEKNPAVKAAISGYDREG